MFFFFFSCVRDHRDQHLLTHSFLPRRSSDLVSRRRSILMWFLLQFHNVLIYVLLVAAVISALLGQVVDTAVILGVVVLNAIVGVVQEGRAERSLEAIRSEEHTSELQSLMRI